MVPAAPAAPVDSAAPAVPVAPVIPASRVVPVARVVALVPAAAHGTPLSRRNQQNCARNRRAHRRW
eukprot:11159401-Lingulodinium_polyedra.AAC.1